MEDRMVDNALFMDEGHEEPLLTWQRQHTTQQRQLSAQQGRPLPPLPTGSLLSRHEIGSRGRNISGHSSDSRPPSRSKRSYEPSERGEYTFSGNTSPLLSTSFGDNKQSFSAREYLENRRRQRTQSDNLSRSSEQSGIRGRNKSRTPPSPPIRRASTKGVPVQSPFPGLKIPGRHPSSVQDLEEAAERMSMASSLEDSIRKEAEVQKKAVSRRSSVRRSSLMNIITDIPYDNGPRQLTSPLMFQSPTSITDVNTAARQGFSPGGEALIRTRNRADSKCSKTSAYGTRPEPPLEGLPLAQFVAPPSRQNSTYSHMSSRNISRAQSIAQMEEEMAAIRRPLAVRNACGDQHDSDLGQQPLGRPYTSDSAAEFGQSQQLFEDFDGQHIDEPPVPSPEHMPPPRQPPIEKRPSSGNNLSPVSSHFNDRPKSYADLLTGQQMVFYPAPVPSMLQLPQKLSKRPNAGERAKRHTQVLATAPSHTRNRSSTKWLPESNEHDVSDAEKRKIFMDDESSNAPTRMNKRDSQMPAQLRANEFFEQMAAAQTIEIKDQSAVKTLDDILNASAFAPVSAFTDHAIMGRLGADIYSSEDYGKKVDRERREMARSEMYSYGFGTSVALTGEGKQVKKEVRKSFFGLGKAVNDDDEFAEQKETKSNGRKSALGLFGTGLKSPTYEVVGEKSPGLVRDDANDSPSDDEEEDQREMDGRYAEDVYTGAPTTLLAELQLRKQQAKQRTQPTSLPQGYRTTLLEMDSVAQVENKLRKQRRVTLAWQDQSVVDKEREQDSEDDEVPLGMLFPEQARRQMDNEHRPMGLLERRELEDNEPLSKRRERLLGNQPLGRPKVVQRASMMNVSTPNNNSNETITPGASVSQLNVSTAVQETPLPPTRPVSGEFSTELLRKFGTPEPPLQLDDAVPEEEETLAQRRKRLIAEREAKEKEMAGEGEPRPIIKQRRSMADVLQAHPARIKTPNAELNKRRSVNRLSSMNLASGHGKTNSSEFPHLREVEKERAKKAELAQQFPQPQTRGLLATPYGGVGSVMGGNYQAQQNFNNGFRAPGGGVGLGTPTMSPGGVSAQSGYFGNKEMVDRMIAMRQSMQMASGGIMGQPGAGGNMGMGPGGMQKPASSEGQWRNQQAQWAHWARMQGLGMGLQPGGMMVGAGGTDMVDAWRKGVGGLGNA